MKHKQHATQAANRKSTCQHMQQAAQAACSTGKKKHRQQAAQAAGSTGSRQHRQQAAQAAGSTGSTVKYNNSVTYHHESKSMFLKHKNKNCNYELKHQNPIMYENSAKKYLNQDCEHIMSIDTKKTCNYELFILL